MSKKIRERQNATSSMQPAAPLLAALPDAKIVPTVEPPHGHFIRHAYDENGELISNAR